MSEIFAPKEIPVIKKSGLVLAMVLCASLLSACDCDGDCNAASSATSAVSADTPPLCDPAPAVAPPTTTTPAACTGRFCKVGSTGARLDPISNCMVMCGRHGSRANSGKSKRMTVPCVTRTGLIAKSGTAGACGGCTVAGCSPTAYADSGECSDYPSLWYRPGLAVSLPMQS